MAVATWVGGDGTGSQQTDYGRAANWSGGVIPDADDHVIVANTAHDCILDTNREAASLVVDSGATLNGSGAKISVKSEGTGSAGTNGYAVDINGEIDGNFDLEINTPAETALDLSATSGNVRNLTINHASCDAGVDSSCTLTGNIEVTAGILELTNYSVSAVLVHGNGEVQIGGSATYTTTNDWRPDNTKLISNGATINIGDQMGGAWNCNDKQAAINCKRLHSTVSMTNGDGRIADNTQENIVGTVTSNEANASVYGPLQGAWKFVTNSSGTKSFALRENFVIEGRMLITGTGAFTTTYSGVDYDILTTPKTYHNSLTGPSDFGPAGNYHGIEVRDSVDFDTNSSNVLLNQALGSELCDNGTFNSGGTGNWVAYSGNTVTNESNTLKVSRPASGGNANGAYVYLRDGTNLTQDLTIGRTYKVSADFKVSAGASITAGLYKGTLDLNRVKYDRLKTSGGGADQITSTSFETRHAYFVAGSSTGDSPYIYFGLDGGMSNGEDVFVDNISVKEVLPHNDGTHQQSWGFRQYSTTAVNFGDGCLITSGFRVVANRDVTKGAGDFITNGAGDSTEYWNFGGGTIDMNMGNTYVTTTLNPNEVNTIGYNHASSDLNLTCTRHNFYAPSSSNHIALWQTAAPTGTTGAKTFTITGDFYIYKGEFRTGYHSGSRYPNGLTVSGDVVIKGDGTLNCSVDNSTTNVNNENDVDVSFGSITIDSGGTYNAAGGNATTTITGDPGGYPNFGINIDGTFTHNNGTLKYTGGGGAFDLSGTGNLYNFEHAPTATTFITTNTTIENNLTMTGANFQGANGNENLTVKGNVTINSSAKSLTFIGTSEHTFGFLTILDGTYKVQNDTGGFTKVGGIRNVGGTVSNAV